MSSQCLQRKFTDIVYKLSSKWVNWDPPIGIQVGTYGTIDKATGDLSVHGNVYDVEFQKELDDRGIKVRLVDHPPQEGPLEDDFIISSCGAKHKDMKLGGKAGAANVADASVKGEWLIESGQREAILALQRPRLTFLPKNVILEHLYKVDKLIGMWLVTAIQTCPAYSMYLSEKTGEKCSVALVAQAPIAGVVGASAGASGGFSLSASTQGGVLRQACDPTGQYSYTPLFCLRRPISRSSWRIWRDSSELSTGDDLWYDDSPPWDPLDEDGEEDCLSPTITSFDASQQLLA